MNLKFKKMKKFSLLSILSLLLITTAGWSQTKFGIKGGLNFNSFKDLSTNVNEMWSSKLGYHAGITAQFRIPAIGLAIQPDLLLARQQSEMTNTPENSITMDYLTLPLNLQLGLDLLLFKPYIVAAPYLSYALQKDGILIDADWKDLNRIDYGVGLGVGFDFWKVQVVGKYVWGFGTLQEAGANPISGISFSDAKREGFQVSLALFF